MACLSRFFPSGLPQHIIQRGNNRSIFLQTIKILQPMRIGCVNCVLAPIMNTQSRYFSRLLSHFVAKQRSYFQDLTILHQYSPSFEYYSAI
jgi:hypothetical protein